MRIVACGSVDDGKSTLIGRLLADTASLFDDELAALAGDSRRFGTRGGAVDYALVLDGLSAEREQAITIDVAWRHFSTPLRRYLLADAPGHEQFTRNMASGASTADVAIVLVDASKGLGTQARRHACILALLGVDQVILAVNKMDQASYSREAFEAITRSFGEFAARIGAAPPTAIPVCAIHGENVAQRAPAMRWYTGPTLLEALDAARVDPERAAAGPLRMPIQWVARPDASFRGYAGTIVGGALARGDRVRVAGSGTVAEIERIVTAGGDLERAQAGQAVMLTFAAPVDASRGDVLCLDISPAPVADRFEADLVWLGDEPLLPGRDYLMKCGTRSVMATVAPLRHRLHVETLEKVAAETLEPNEIGVAEIELDRPIAFDPYRENRAMGGFILVDRISAATVAAGMLRFALRRSANVRRQEMEVTKAARQHTQRHKSAIVWLTGLPGAGKSTLASRLEARLHAMGLRTYVLDGDNLRHGLNKDLGFTPADRVENIRRAGEVARLMVDAGVIVIAAFISPFRAERRMVRGLVEPGEFVEVFVDTPLEIAEARDPKGLYAKARRGEIANFTGVGAPYEPPEAPEIRIDAGNQAPEESERDLFERLSERGLFDRM